MHVLALDPNALSVVAALGVAVVGAASAIVVAVVNNKKERGGAAENAVEEALKQRIILRDEQLAVKDSTIERLEEERDALEQELKVLKDGRMT